MLTPTALAVMVRYPVVGEVKTRLARHIGAERACVLYRAFLQDIQARFAGHRRTLVWAFYPPEKDYAALVKPGTRVVPQEGRDLGERLHNCFRRLCNDGFERVLIIGGDVPHVRDEWLDEAEASLNTADVVLGPSMDGGYYLIAMCHPHDVFSGIQMSTASVLAETCRKAESAGLRLHLLPASFDIDEAADLARLSELLRDHGYARLLPATAAVLKSGEY